MADGASMSIPQSATEHAVNQVEVRWNQPTIDPMPSGVGIQRVENGFMVTVGCKTFVAMTLAEIFEGLELYFKDSKAAVEKYCRK